MVKKNHVSVKVGWRVAEYRESIKKAVMNKVFHWLSGLWVADFRHMFCIYVCYFRIVLWCYCGYDFKLDNTRHQHQSLIFSLTEFDDIFVALKVIVSEDVCSRRGCSSRWQSWKTGRRYQSCKKRFRSNKEESCKYWFTLIVLHAVIYKCSYL